MKTILRFLGKLALREPREAWKTIRALGLAAIFAICLVVVVIYDSHAAIRWAPSVPEAAILAILVRRKKR